MHDNTKMEIPDIQDSVSIYKNNNNKFTNKIDKLNNEYRKHSHIKQ